MSFDLSNYEPVEDRLQAFWKEHPTGRVLTNVVNRDAGAGMWVVKAEAYRNEEDERPAATGYAFEIEGSNPVNKTSALENCETSAIGRALANLGFAAKGKRASREEMTKATGVSGPTQSGQAAEGTAPSCPNCGSGVWDNSEDPQRGNRPVFKCRDKACDWATWNEDFFVAPKTDWSEASV